MMLVLPEHLAVLGAEALWKQEGAKCCQFLRNRAQGAPREADSKWRKCRRNTQTSAIVHGSFATTHNLKVTGSNPVPATKSLNKTKELNVERFACV